LEEEDEGEVYSTPLCTLDSTRGVPLTKDDLIKNLIQNPHPNVLWLEELVEGAQANTLVDLFVADLTSSRVRNLEFSPERRKAAITNTLLLPQQ